jgi:hypothetical protein
MGYLLARVHRRSAEGDLTMPVLTTRGATQHVTTDPARYISIPHSDDPRQPSEPNPVAAVTIQYPPKR